MRKRGFTDKKTQTEFFIMVEPAQGNSVGLGSRKTRSALTVSGMSSMFDYDEKILVERMQRERIDSCIQPIGGVVGDGPYEFALEPVANTFLLTPHCYLYIKCKVVRENGTDLQATDDVSTANLLGTALWEHTETYLNDYNISGASSTNTNIKGAVETFLSYDTDAMNTHLQAEHFSMDSAGHYENFTENGENSGYIDRGNICARSAEFDFTSRITSDFVSTSNLLGPGNKLSFKFYRARDSFLLCAQTNLTRYKLLIIDLKLHYTRVRLDDSVKIPREERYLMTKTLLKRFHVPRNQTSFTEHLITGGRMPRMVILFQMATSAVEGMYSRNPFYFRHYNVNRLSLAVNGRSVPSQALTPNFQSNPPRVAREYLHMFLNTGAYRINRGNCISLKQFQNGLTLFPFDLSPDLCNGLHVHEGRDGHIGIELTWAEPLAESVTVFAYCAFDVVLINPKISQAYMEYL